MARRRTARTKMPLEWKTDTINTTDATVTNGQFDLDLLPDEIAAILGIKSIIRTGVTTAVIDEVLTRMYLSMDPDVVANPLTNVNLQDLEVFYVHDFGIQADYAEATETGGWAVKLTDEDQMWFPGEEPLLVGTNFSQVVIGDVTKATEFITTVYFKRRKANAIELNQILLKRR